MNFNFGFIGDENEISILEKEEQIEIHVPRWLDQIQIQHWLSYCGEIINHENNIFMLKKLPNLLSTLYYQYPYFVT